MAKLKSPIDAEDWTAALGLLESSLQEHNCISTRALAKELTRKSIADPNSILHRLRFHDEEELDVGLARPAFKFFHHGRTFYSETAYNALEKETEEKANTASAAEAAERDVLPEEEIAERRNYRQEEARLVKYVEPALEELYASEFGPDDIERIAFDVHMRRQGNEYENVDVFAVHWRSDKRVDIVTVEVKLHFGPQVVHQAHNYTRFSNRVWIAVPVRTAAAGAGALLREDNPSLFDYAVEVGLGILGCHRRQGGRYDVFPVHWPRRFEPDPLLLDGFINQHRSSFEESRVVEPQKRSRYAQFR